jgi:hypothetical protein
MKDCAKAFQPVTCVLPKIVLKVAAVGQACNSDVKKFWQTQPGEGRTRMHGIHLGRDERQCIAALLEALPGIDQPVSDRTPASEAKLAYRAPTKGSQLVGPGRLTTGRKKKLV